MMAKQSNHSINGKKFIPLGWREWVYFPNYNNFSVKAKIDTGASSSALHATHVKEYRKKGQTWIKFRIYQFRDCLHVDTRVTSYKKITNSFGDSEIRPMIQMKIRLGIQSWKTDITLTRRTGMTYPMLIGRNSLKKKHIIHSHKSYLTGADRKKPS